jgi:hypothetical protein
MPLVIDHPTRFCHELLQRCECGIGLLSGGSFSTLNWIISIEIERNELNQELLSMAKLFNRHSTGSAFESKKSLSRDSPATGSEGSVHQSLSAASSILLGDDTFEDAAEVRAVVTFEASYDSTWAR